MSVSRLTPAERSQRSRRTADERAAETQAARDGLARKWEASANPEAAKRAHYTRLALASSKKRRSAA